MLAATLIEVLEAHGGELRTRSRVASIDIADRVATGVRLTDGTSLTAPLVISNADYRRTVLDLAGAEHFNPRIGRTTREATMGLPFATVYVALDRELTRRAEANIWWYDHEDIDELYRGLYSRRAAGGRAVPVRLGRLAQESRREAPLSARTHEHPADDDVPARLPALGRRAGACRRRPVPSRTHLSG